jgi:hypothetical protein
MPTAFSIQVDVDKEPERQDYREPIEASQTIKNHLPNPESLEWQS